MGNPSEAEDNAGKWKENLDQYGEKAKEGLKNFGDFVKDGVQGIGDAAKDLWRKYQSE